MENKVIKHIEINGTTYDVPTIDGFDFSALGWSAQGNADQNDFIKHEINRAIEKAKTWNETLTGHSGTPFWSFYYNAEQNYVFYAKLKTPNLQSLYGIFSRALFAYINLDDAIEGDNLETCSIAFQEMYNLNVLKFGTKNHFTKCKNASGMLEKAYNISYIDWENFAEAPLTDASYMFKEGAFKMEVIDLSKLQTNNITNMAQMFYSQGTYPKQLNKKIKGLDMYSCTNANGITQGRNTLTDFECVNWRLCDLPLNTLNLLTPQSINYIIEHALGDEDGATARTLTLHATAKANWMDTTQNPDYEYYQAMATEKLITIA